MTNFYKCGFIFVYSILTVTIIVCFGNSPGVLPKVLFYAFHFTSGLIFSIICRNVTIIIAAFFMPILAGIFVPSPFWIISSLVSAFIVMLGALTGTEFVKIWKKAE